MSDWETVTVLRKKPPKPSTMKTEKAINVARRQGIPIDTQQKWGAGSNKQHATTKNTAKLDRETEELKHDHVPLELGKLIQQARQEKKMSQKDLASKINEKPQIIQEYENGKAIPDQSVIGKIERTLCVKLRGKDRGKPLLFPPGAKK
ncbi:hypothetical protein V9T40_005157 [Parthenolecanium corni]|uniref:HTH cro/C1-type domain-containing protein n=1 Tax=Parthenolecanium corni TaxID=536013 RepID=A0AAN9Y2L2_9HEMI